MFEPLMFRSRLEMSKNLCKHTPIMGGCPSVKGNNALNVEQASTWDRGKAAYIAFTLLTLLIIAVLVDISLYQQKSEIKNLANLVSFACRPFSSNQTFTIDVAVNLTDNMDQDEAIMVAFEVYERIIRFYASIPASFSTTAYVSADGSWLVKFDMAYPISSYCAQRLHLRTRVIRERFVANINPFVRTVEYGLV